MKPCKYKTAKMGDIGGDLVMGAVVLIGGYFIYNKLFGNPGPSVPTGTSPVSGQTIPLNTDPTNANTASVAKEDAALWVTNYENTRGVKDPFGAGPYNANAAASTMDFDTLSALAGKINDAGPGFWSGLTKSGGDWSVVFGILQQYCTNQVDVSNLSIVFNQLYGQDIINWMDDPNNMGNGAIHAGVSNMEGIQKIIQYALSLPPQ